jgi:membrane protease YdiL (CAAX protease family)
MNQPIQPHTVWQSLGLHLIPGVLITAFYFLIAPSVIKAGYPVLMAILLAILVILIPFELGYLLYQGKRQTGQLSLKTVVLNREPLPLWQYFILVPLLLGWCAIIFISLSPLDSYIIRTFFAWMPSWLITTTSQASMSHYPTSKLFITIVSAFALNGIAGPIVEELYFRGYLLPRIPSSRAWAPLINVLLFSLYHFFSPWQNITRILALIPMVYTVSWKRNIYLSIFTHCLLNTFGMLSMIKLLLLH